MWAIDRLARACGLPARHRWSDVALTLADWPTQSRGYLTGRIGALSVAHVLAPSEVTAERLAREIEGGLALRSNELMLGAPGATLAAVLAAARSDDRRFVELARRGAEQLIASFDDDGLTTQRIFGDRPRYLGLVHGFAGNAAVLVRAGSNNADLTARLIAAAEATAVREGSVVSWPAVVGERPRLMQICHGAPGVVVALASIAALHPTLRGAAEAIVRAGPLVKETNLCHGDAGNGFALLALHRATADAAHLASARAFAMSAITRCDAARERFGRGRYSLWTGDLGLGLFLLACVREDGVFPTLDAL